MGKLQSKHACKRRENPEGGAFKEAVDCTSEVDRNGDKQDLFGKDSIEDQLSDHYCALEVTLPHKRGMENHKSFTANRGQPSLKDGLRRNVANNDVECRASVMNENLQEWLITLYDFDNNGKVTRENMLNLMHTIYEVIEASVKQLVISNGTTLRVKLSVTPLTRGNRKDRDSKTFKNEQDQMEETVRYVESQPSQTRGPSSAHVGAPEKKHYSVDENTERRNHYLDLAGIENYTSQFEAAPEPSAEEQHQDIPFRAHQRRSHIETCSPVESSGRSVSFLRSLRSRSKSIGGNGGIAKPSKVHGHHPVTWCQPQPQVQSSSKRLRARSRETTTPSRANQGLEREFQPGQTVGFKPVPQRHEHHHHHDHHHHHYHHHYPPT